MFKIGLIKNGRIKGGFARLLENGEKINSNALWISLSFHKLVPLSNT